MRIQLGESILTSDGQDAAVVDRVILDQAGRDVIAVVLRSGTFFPHDVEVQLDQLTEDDAGHHRLVYNAAELDQLPRFDESQYTTPPPDLALPYDYDRQMVAWPAGGVGPLMPIEASPIASDPRVSEELVGRIYEHDAENAVIAEGSAIISSDDEKVGELERLAFDSDSGRLISVIVRQGLFFPSEHRLPGYLVASASDGKLYLNVDKAHVEELTRQKAVPPSN